MLVSGRVRPPKSHVWFFNGIFKRKDFWRLFSFFFDFYWDGFLGETKEVNFWEELSYWKATWRWKPFTDPFVVGEAGRKNMRACFCRLFGQSQRPKPHVFGRFSWFLTFCCQKILPFPKDRDSVVGLLGFLKKKMIGSSLPKTGWTSPMTSMTSHRWITGWPGGRLEFQK